MGPELLLLLAPLEKLFLLGFPLVFVVTQQAVFAARAMGELREWGSGLTSYATASVGTGPR